jgi:hypothetical protein
MVNVWTGDPFLCDRGCNQMIFWKENQHMFMNMYSGVGGDQGNRHACPNRVGWSKGSNSGPTTLPEIRHITAKDLEIAACNPKKHNYIKEILDNIYGPINSDRWLCKNCKDHGDKFWMMCHICKRNIKK